MLIINHFERKSMDYQSTRIGSNIISKICVSTTLDQHQLFHFFNALLNEKYKTDHQIKIVCFILIGITFCSISKMESGGTVLSTNWNEVGKEKVSVKPPDGMEYKKWEQQIMPSSSLSYSIILFITLEGSYVYFYVTMSWQI